MSNIMLLDCTLREAPLDGLQWGDLSLHRAICDLAKAKVQIIECGFLKDVSYEKGSAYFSDVKQIKSVIGEKKKGVIYAALVDYGRFNVDTLSDNDGESVDLIRVCFKKKEIDMVLEYAKKIQDKGYLVAIQHVNTCAYTDEEIVRFVKKVNAIQPYAYSVVDTFGSMYQDDVIRLAKLIDKYLDKNIKFGFHGHNNLMLANSNAQQFIVEMSKKRQVVVDSSLNGCGRGAGNANTELLAEFIRRKYDGDYDIDILLDLIDRITYMAKKRTEWGYSVPYFIAGMNDAHSFNVKYLTQRHNLKHADLRAIIGMLDEERKKTYDYQELDRLYMDYFGMPVNDTDTLAEIMKIIGDREVLLLAPGKSVKTNRQKISSFIAEKNPIVIGVNTVIDNYKQDIVFYSGIRRYEMLPFIEMEKYGNPLLIKTSNIRQSLSSNELIVDYCSLIKKGWVYFDSSIILLLRLLVKIGIKNVYIAGLDGYKSYGNAFYTNEMETALSDSERAQASRENGEMLKDIVDSSNLNINFITKSEYERYLD